MRQKSRRIHNYPGPSADGEGADGGHRRAGADHPGYNGGIGGDFVIDKRVKPGIFDVPADLASESQNPDQNPVFAADSLHKSSFI